MRICYLANGESVHSRRWLEWSIERGYEVFLITSGPSNLKEIKEEYIFPFKRKGGYIPRPTFIAKIRKIIKQLKPDILHAFSLTPFGMYGALTNYHPFIFSAFGSDVRIYPRKSFLTNLIVKYSLKEADLITTTSITLKEDIIKKYNISPKKIHQFYWGIDLSIFHTEYKGEALQLRKKLKIPHDAFVIFSPRNLFPNAGIDKLIEVMPKIIEEIPNTYCIILRGIGYPEYLKRMMQKARDLGIEGNIRFISEFLTQIEMAIYLNASNVLVSLLQTDQFGASILESMACRCIPVLSDLTVYKEHLQEGKNALFVDRDSLTEIAETLIYCGKHLYELQSKMALTNQHIVEKKENWSKNANQMGVLYENLLDTHRKN